MVPVSLTRSEPSVCNALPLAGRGGVGRQPANISWLARAERRAMVRWGALLGGLSIMVLLGSVWVRLQVVEAGYRLSATRQLVERLEARGRELAVRAAAADAPDKLALLAERRLKMRPPEAAREVWLP